MIIDGATHTVTGFGVGFWPVSKAAYFLFFHGHNPSITVVDKGGDPIRYIKADTTKGVYRRYKRENGHYVFEGPMGSGRAPVIEDVAGPLRLQFKYPLQIGFIR